MGKTICSREEGKGLGLPLRYICQARTDVTQNHGDVTLQRAAIIQTAYDAFKADYQAKTGNVLPAPVKFSFPELRM